ncbi:hypothetical protein QVZ41_14305 [Wenyingzhuangia sp. chi5]|uniref:YD repeat-containing protein n=1 Tax=Wenyingzhuangia gilva TaxID=3057677 RepID=A0ABT8VVL9_9FLAO|nr:hypothetical protein [Wenyingzhuangia sp. chi5]MDO3696021.1 hypothetical protein [Wenyingzhuangia sp. chi5]
MKTTNYYYYKTFLFIVFFYTHFVYSQLQPSLPPSPNASSLLSFIDNEVSYFTGTPNISIPIYEIDKKSIQLDISLNYNPNGITTNTTASLVGLGWSLNAGGVISRVMKDAPDDSKTDRNHFQEYNHPYYRDWPATKLGYLYSIKENDLPVKTIGGYSFSPLGYKGVNTYKLDLEEIYQNRQNQTPEDAILHHFGVVKPRTYAFSHPLGPLREFNKRILNPFYQLNDLEPDIFYFNFLGYSGRFVFDPEHSERATIKLIPYQDLKIDYITDSETGNLIAFTIKDTKGNVFKFNDAELSINLSQSLPQSGRPELLSTSHINNESRRKFNNSWWLSEVVTANGEMISFEYEDVIEKNLSQSMYPGLGLRSSKKAENLNAYSTTYTKTHAKRLAKITTDNLLIDFDYDLTRLDLITGSTAKALTSITINTTRNNQIKKINLKYDYFLSSEDKTVQYYKDDYEYSEGASHNGNKKLRLKSLLEYGKNLYNPLTYTFEYNYYDQGDKYPSYKKFPNLYSYNTDLWNFANGANNKTPVPSLNIYPDNYPKGDIRAYNVYEKNTYIGRHLKTIGGNRLPNKDYMDIGVLTKIQYPTGGSTNYSYKPRTFIYEEEEYIGGGLAIDKVIKQTNDNLITYNYSYNMFNNSNVSSGKIVSMPFFADLSYSFYLTEYLNANDAEVFPYKGYGYYPGHPYYNLYPTDFILFNNKEDIIKISPDIFSYPISKLGSGFENNFGYTNVTEYITNKSNKTNGYTEFTYSFPASIDDVDISNEPFFERTKVHNLYMKGSDLSVGNFEYFPNTYLSYSNPPNSNYNWNRGLLLKRKVKDENKQLIEQEEYIYEDYFPLKTNHPTKVYGVIIVGAQNNDVINNDEIDDYIARVSNYCLLTNVTKVLSSKKVTDYLEGEEVTNTINYDYEGTKHINTTKITQNIYNDKTRTTNYKYSFDYELDPFFGGVIKTMNDKNILKPIEVTNYIEDNLGNKNVIDSKVTKYKEFDGKILPESIYELHKISDSDNNFTPSYVRYIKVSSSPSSTYTKEDLVIDSKYREDIHINRYDNKGNIQEVEDTKTGVRTTYIWSYHQQYPIAKIENASYSEVQTEMEELEQEYDYVPLNSNEEYSQYLRIIFKDLRSILTNTMITTYTYDPLIGMTSMTDPKGYTIYYEYDDFNRLEFVKDADGKILSKNEYHYKGQQ